MLKTTMIGSMPHTNASEAVARILRSPLLVPAWPQLPKRSFKESMVNQYAEGFPGIRIDEKEKRVWVEQGLDLPDSMARFYEDVLSEKVDPFGISTDFAEGFHAFFRETSRSEKLPMAKGQVTGPLTFGLGLCDQTGKAVWFDPQLRDAAVKNISMKALWQIRELKKVAGSVLIFMDEPVLSALGTPGYLGIEDSEVVLTLTEVAEAIRAQGALVGIHCCGNMNWALLAELPIDLLSFDAYAYAEKLALYPDAISAFLQRGGKLAWGIVPTADSDKVATSTPEGLHASMKKLVGDFIKKGIPEDRLRSQMVLTPSCGAGNLSIDEASRVLELLGKTAELVF